MKNDIGLLVLVVRMASAEVLKCDLSEISVEAEGDSKNPTMLVLTVKKNDVEISPDEERQLGEYMEKMRAIPISRKRNVCRECNGTGHPFGDPLCGHCPSCGGEPWKK